MADILISGGTGLVGTALTRDLLSKGHTVSILTRTPRNSAEKRLQYITWNEDDELINKDAIQAADYIVHLAGANVAEKRWTEKRKAEIIASRVKTGELIARSLQKIPNDVRAVISASGIGWYGADDVNKREQGFVETDPPSNDFLGQVCMQWENALQPIVSTGIRLVIFRFGLVFSREGGAYQAFRKPMRFRLAPVLGNGRQVISWIHIEDCIRMIQFAMDRNIAGVYNAVAPEPITNKELNRLMASVKGGWHFFPKAPAVALKLALGELSIELLKSARVSSEKIQRAGFSFLYKTPYQAIQQLEAS